MKPFLRMALEACKILSPWVRFFQEQLKDRTIQPEYVDSRIETNYS